MLKSWDNLSRDGKFQAFWLISGKVNGCLGPGV